MHTQLLERANEMKRITIDKEPHTRLESSLILSRRRENEKSRRIFIPLVIVGLTLDHFESSS